MDEVTGVCADMRVTAAVKRSGLALCLVGGGSAVTVTHATNTLAHASAQAPPATEGVPSQECAPHGARQFAGLRPPVDETDADAGEQHVRREAEPEDCIPIRSEPRDDAQREG